MRHGSMAMLLALAARPARALVPALRHVPRAAVARRMSDAPVNLVVDPETGAEMSKSALKKLQKQRKIDAKKAAKKETQAENAAPAAVISGPPLVATEVLPFSTTAPGGDAPRFGDMAPCRSQHLADAAPAPIKALAAGQNAWVRCRVAAVRSTGRAVFLVLRSLDDAAETLQACYFKDKSNPRSSEALKFLKRLTSESIVDCRGSMTDAAVETCSRRDVELQLDSVLVVTRAPATLPFLVEDASRSEAEIEASQSTERPFASVSQEARLDYRWLELRTPASAATLKLQAAVCRLYRNAMDTRGFVEIHSPKLIAGESESGAGVFTTDYFGETACLAQSPQLYKQLAVIGDLGGVYEVGPVFRAENSNTRRHLCEFTGLDFEVPIVAHYTEAINIGHGVFKAIFEGLETECADLLESVRAQFPSEPVVIGDAPVVLHFEDALQLLRDAGHAPEGGDDLSGSDELLLGKLVKEQHGVDFFVIDRYPATIRPFYTMLDPADEARSNSYDFFLRGQEICSGAQRVHDPALLRAQCEPACVFFDGVRSTHRRVPQAPREGSGPRGPGPLGLAQGLPAGLRPRRAAARGLRLRPGARRVPVPRAGQHPPRVALPAGPEAVRAVGEG